MDQLAAMRSFVQVVDRGGFASAGRVLGLSGPMVGNHVRFIEGQLGGRLLNRTTRAQSLTELGRAYLARCRSILAELETAEADAAELLGAPRGLLRVTAPHSIGLTVLPPVVSAFLRDFPAVAVDLYLEDKRIDLVAEGFDVALRVGELEDAALVTRTLGPLELVVCASPDYIAHRGEPATPGGLASHDCLDFAASSTPGVWHFEGAEGAISVAVAGPLRANSGLALRAAALAGTGMVMLPRMLLREELETGRLVPLLTGYRAQSRPIQLLTLPGQQPAPKLRCFIDCLVRVLGRVPGDGVAAPPSGLPAATAG